MDLQGKRIVVTQAKDFMGPVLVDVLQRQGAEVIASEPALLSQDIVAAEFDAAGAIDAVVINLAMPAPGTPIAEVPDTEWQQVFAYMVDPLMRIVRYCVPEFKARGAGKFVVMGSASALRGMKLRSSYSAARGAQIGFVQSAGVELARDNIQINLIAQNFVENPTYFPPEVQALPTFQERLDREVPLGRLVSGEEDAQFAAYLCGEHANHFVGQIFPVCGGWVQR